MSVNNSITGGTISVEDCIKHTGYPDPQFAPTRKVRVELLFTTPEGQDGAAFMNGVARVANDKVTALLNKTPEVAGAATPAEKRHTVVVDETTGKPETAAAKKKREAKAAEAAKPERTKADLEREAGLPVTHKAPSDDELLNDEPTITAAGKVVEEPKDELDDLLGDAAPAPITDLELGKAAQEKNAKMKAEFGEAWAPAKIRTLIATFAGEGKRINDIPVAKRKDFMAQLAALK